MSNVRSRWTAAFAAVLVPLLTSGTASAALITINFDDRPGMTNSPGAIVPVANRLSDELLATTGARFSSAVGYVAVVSHAPDPTVSMPNVIAGVTADGRMSYGTAITIEFFDPLNTGTAAVTDFVSIRGDKAPLTGATASLEAFDVDGQSLGKVTAFDTSAGLTLTFNAPGIHSVVLTQNSAAGSVDGTIGFDDLSFNSVQAVPEPASAALLGIGAAGLIFFRRRRQREALRDGPPA